MSKKGMDPQITQITQISVWELYLIGGLAWNRSCRKRDRAKKCL
jgi:hypothetical protein